MNWRINTKPEQFSSGAPWCSWTTLAGRVLWPWLTNIVAFENLELHLF